MIPHCRLVVVVVAPQAAPASSNVFVIASRSEKFEYDSNFYQRTHRYSNYSTHASDDGKGNVEVLADINTAVMRGLRGEGDNL